MMDGDKSKATEHFSRIDTAPSYTDRIATVADLTFGAIPVIGPIVAKIAGEIIPNQRVDRMAKLLEVLWSQVRLMDADQEKLKAAFNRPDFVDLLEDGFQQAARALSDERLAYIASLLKEGLIGDQMQDVEVKKLLYLLNEINDIEVIVLRSYADFASQAEAQAFRLKHQQVLYSPKAHLSSSDDVIAKQRFYDAYRNHLVRLHLLRPKFQQPKNGRMPEFDDKTGGLKAMGFEMAPLGRLLAHHIFSSEEASAAPLVRMDNEGLGSVPA
jgi:hypothetical protein